MPWASLVLTLPSVPTDPPGKRASPRRTQQVGCLGLWPGEHHKRRLRLRLLIEEKVRQTPESFLDRGKALLDPTIRSPEGSFLSWKRNPIRTRAPEALASGTVFVPFAHIDRLVRIGKVKTKLFSFLPF